MQSTKGTSRVSIGNILEHIAALYNNVFEPPAQAVENGGDAIYALPQVDAKGEIWVVLEPKFLSVIDTGIGMVPYMAKDESARLDKLFDTGRPVSGFDLDEIVPLGSWSRHSLEWCMRCIGLSSKKPGRKGTKGMKGLGFFAYLVYADSAVVLSRPTVDLAYAYWNDESIARDNPVYRLDAPRRIHFGGGKAAVDPTYEIALSEEDLKDPYGRALSHGTRFQYALRDGVQEILKATALANHFRDRFGQDISEGKYRLIVVDRTGSKEKAIEVQPPEYKGIELLSTTDKYEGVEFALYAAYDPRCKLPIIVRHKGSKKFPITQLDNPNFQKAPWNNSDVTGYVDFPVLPNEDQLWDSGKNRLQGDKQDVRRWAHQVSQYGRQIEEKLKAVRDRQKENALNEIAKSAAGALMDAMGSLEEFQDFVIPGISTKREKKNNIYEDPKPRNIVGARASVVDEYSRGVKSVEVQLWKGGPQNRAQKWVGTKETDSSGFVSFGEQQPGLYLVRIAVPEGMKLHPGNPVPELKASISEGRRHFRVVFQLITGRPKPESKKRMSRIEVVPTPFLDRPELPYEQWLESGQILINTIDREVDKAIESEDLERLASLIAQFLSAGTAEYYLAGEEPREMMYKVTKLFKKTHENMRQDIATIKKSVAQNRRK